MLFAFFSAERGALLLRGQRRGKRRREKESFGRFQRRQRLVFARARRGSRRGVSPLFPSFNLGLAVLSILLPSVPGGDHHAATAIADRETVRGVAAGEFDSVFCGVFRRSEEPKLDAILSIQRHAGCVAGHRAHIPRTRGDAVFEGHIGNHDTVFYAEVGI